MQGVLEAVAERHGQVQRGKFDKGSPKLPWLEKEGLYQLTLARVGELNREPTEFDDVGVHAYLVAPPI